MFIRRMPHEDTQTALVPKTAQSEVQQDADEIRRQMYERIACGQAMSNMEASAQRKFRGR